MAISPGEAVDIRPVLVARQITKRFGSTVANTNIDFDLLPREIHALLGENGAGKSTLLSILYGLTSPDSGEVILTAEPLKGWHLHHDRWRYIGMVPQQFRLVPNMTVAEHVALRLTGERTRFSALIKRVGIKVNELSERYDLQLRPNQLVSGLSIGERQRLEILRALYMEPTILLLDEPTSVLTPQEAEKLYSTLQYMVRSEGKAVVLTTHRMKEVLDYADRVTVLRSGKRTAVLSSGQVTFSVLVEAMLGERTMSVVAHPSVPDHASLVLLEAEDLHLVTHPGRTADLTPLHGISFTVRDGEIFGIAGVEGNGQTALELILAGLLEPSSGRLLLRRSRKAASLDTVASSEQKSRRNLDLGYIPSDRARFGVVASLTVQENLLLPRLAHASGLQPSPIQGVTAAETADLIGAFRIEPPNPRLMVSQLSGGNMQKVVLARELSRNPLVTVAAQPTAGLDVGAASMFRTRLREHANAGAGVVLISSDLDELLEVADKIAVMYRGRLSQPWARSQFDVQAIGAAMAGGVTG